MIKRNLNKTKTFINKMSAGVSYSEEIWMEINFADKKRMLDILTQTLFNHRMCVTHLSMAAPAVFTPEQR